MIDVALFGAGRIGTIHAGNLAKEAGARLKYVVDPNAKAAQVAGEPARARAPRPWTQVFDDGSVGAVLICSSTDTHADLIQAAAAAGKQIFCEKPVDLDARSRPRPARRRSSARASPASSDSSAATTPRSRH